MSVFPADDAVCGIVLAAGAGRRRGGPKALVVDAEGPWLARSVDLLREAGCDPVVVVLGAAVEEAERLLAPDPRVEVVVAEHWRDGMGASLRAGLTRATGAAAVVMLVDLPGTPPAVLSRVLADPVDTSTLRQAVFSGRPGHPVVVGRRHWAPLVDTLHGDQGARRYLLDHGVTEVECADLHHGRDVDH